MGEYKFLFVGLIIGGILGYMRMKSSPTPMTQNAKGF